MGIIEEKIITFGISAVGVVVCFLASVVVLEGLAMIAHALGWI